MLPAADSVGAMAFPTAAELSELLAPAVADFGLDLENVKATPAGKKSVIAVAVDADERPDLDRLEEVSKRLSDLLDAAEERGELRLGAGYTLQVTTPGIDTPLTAPRHWRRNRHRLVELTAEGETPQTWRIGPLDAAEETVALVGADLSVRLLKVADSPRAVVQVEFSSAPEQETELTGADFESLNTVTRKDDK
ncbi:ribosome maturation factor RimP [Corynebacterium frankenforstense]